MSNALAKTSSPPLAQRLGLLADRITQLWVRLTGRRVDPATHPWLTGPVGRPDGIGADFFDLLARAESLEVSEGGNSRGLIQDLSTLAGDGFEPAQVHPQVRAFYEQTAAYEMESWAEWCGPFRLFGWLLARLFSRRLQQLNVPLSPLDPSLGTSTRVVHLLDPRTGAIRYTGWVRRLHGTGNVLYAGSYSVERIRGFNRPSLKVVFPLPNGNAQVHLRPEVDDSGALLVISAGTRFGDPGFYFTVQRPNGMWARYVRTMRETIRVYPALDDGVRADHTMWLWGMVFLRLHYRSRRRPSISTTAVGPLA
jgi:hypothetical protein